MYGIYDIREILLTIAITGFLIWLFVNACKYGISFTPANYKATSAASKSRENRFVESASKSWKERFVEAARNNQNDLARKVLRKGAEAGDIYCMETLALFYDVDTQSGAEYGIQPNSALSVFWYQRAADAGSASAMMSLSYAYSLGEGVEVDEDKAFELMKHAADTGHPEANRSLGDYYSNPLKPYCDHGKAIGCYKKALKTNDNYSFAAAASALGNEYLYPKKLINVNGLPTSADNPYYNPKRAAYSYVVAYYADSDYNANAPAKAKESGYSISDEELRNWANDGRNLRYNFNI